MFYYSACICCCWLCNCSYCYSTQKKQSEAIEIERENNAKLETINTKLAQAKQAAEQAFEVASDDSQSKSDFLASMSHDIRTPLNAIIGITSLIRYDANSEMKVRGYADKIDVSAQHLLGIINDVLDMSKIEAGKNVFKYSDFSIQELMEKICIMFRPQAEAKHQDLVISYENILHKRVNGDHVHLMQIFSNLLSNAVKYTREGGKIQFLAEECETNSRVYGKYRFVVCDNGMGMSADFKDKIFDAFTRAESSLTNRIQGTGLGMAITRNLVEAMGGTIDVESELGKGSCFEILIDLKIAEDNELNAEILTELLKIEGAECTICENGKKLVETFGDSAPGEYDMILMEVLKKTIKSIKSVMGAQISISKLCRQDMEMRFLR